MQQVRKRSSSRNMRRGHLRTMVIARVLAPTSGIVTSARKSRRGRRAVTGNERCHLYGPHRSVRTANTASSHVRVRSDGRATFGSGWAIAVASSIETASSCNVQVAEGSVGGSSLRYCHEVLLGSLAVFLARTM